MRSPSAFRAHRTGGQLSVRAFPSHGRGRRFNPYSAHHAIHCFQCFLSLVAVCIRQLETEHNAKLTLRSVENPWTLFTRRPKLDVLRFRKLELSLPGHMACSSTRRRPDGVRSKADACGRSSDISLPSSHTWTRGCSRPLSPRGFYGIAQCHPVNYLAFAVDFKDLRIMSASLVAVDDKLCPQISPI